MLVQPRRLFLSHLLADLQQHVGAALRAWCFAVRRAIRAAAAHACRLSRLEVAVRRGTPERARMVAR